MGSSAHGARSSRPELAADGTVDRNTSVRSVMTLPAYRQSASSGEQVLGREGERDGVDVVLDLPTPETEEILREQEMNTLYQIRAARRRQMADREELRRQRRDARRRRDGGALATIRSRSRAAESHRQELDDLRRTVGRIQETRLRSVSSVSYADLGVARHDGTRIRANSNESERIGLLSDAASITLSNRSAADLAASTPAWPLGESTISLVSAASGDSPPPSRSRPQSGPPSLPTNSVDWPLRSSPGPDLTEAQTEAQVEADIADVPLPPPPDYAAVAATSSLQSEVSPPDYPEVEGCEGEGEVETGLALTTTPTLPAIVIEGSGDEASRG